MKKKPQVDTWLTHGSKAAWQGLTEDDAKEVMSVLGLKGQQKRSFWEGYYRGRITEATYTLTTLMDSLKRNDLRRLGDELQRVRRLYAGPIEEQDEGAG